MAEKRLIVVVEGTAAMGAFWKSIVQDYLDKMIRNFCNNELTQDASIPSFELALVVFGTRGPCSTFLVRRTGWTRNIDIFFQWLSSIPFSGGGFSDAAITEGLSEALMMFPLSNTDNEAQKNADVDKHCILVTASNPYPLATPVYRPTMQIGEQTKNGDAEDVARSFSQCSISLSVISPKQLAKLRAIFNAGKCLNGVAEMPGAENQKYPNFLVLISEKFIESCSLLSKPVTTNMPSNPVKVEVTCVGAVSGPCPSPPAIMGAANVAVPPVNGAASPMEVGHHTSPPPPPPSLYSHVPTAPRLPASSSPVSQEVTSIVETVQEMKPPPPVVGAVPPPRSGPSATANMNILNSISQARLQSMAGATSSPMHMLPAGGVPSSALQQPGLASPDGTSVGQGNVDPSGMPQQLQLPGQHQSSAIAMVSCASSPQPVPPASAMQQSAQPTKYVKVWEGHLSGQRQGQSVFITRLEGYRCASASETLASNWPPTMQIVRLIAQNYMSENSDVRQYLGKADYLVFRALNQHNFLAQLQEKKLCAVIQLPSQTLLLSVSEKAFRLIGMLFPGDMVVFKPTSHPSQQQQQQQQQVQQSMQQVKPQMSGTPQMVQQQSMQSLAYLGHPSAGRPQMPPPSQVPTQTSAMNAAAFLVQ